MQRVRIGLTGLACVFLLVVLAASLFGLLGGDQASVAPAGNAIANAAGDLPREPLAELGVTPGGSTGEATTNSVQPLPEIPGS